MAVLAINQKNNKLQMDMYLPFYPLPLKEISKMDHSIAHKHANSILLEPNDTGEIIWKFSTSTKLEIACNVPGHYEAGMIARIIKD